MSIDAELACAHSEIINLSRASPIERIAAESIRRKSWGEIEVDTAALGFLKEGEAMIKQDEDQVSDRKIDGIEPVTKEGQEEALCDETGIEGTMTATMAHTPQMEEYKDFDRPGSSLSVASTSHTSSGFIGMFRRPSMRKQDKHNENEDKEIASEMMSKRLNGNRSSSRNSSHRSKSSMGNGRNVISKSNGAGGWKSSGRERQGSQAGLQIVINKVSAIYSYLPSTTLLRNHPQSLNAASMARAEWWQSTRGGPSVTRLSSMQKSTPAVPWQL